MLFFFKKKKQKTTSKWCGIPAVTPVCYILICLCKVQIVIFFYQIHYNKWVNYRD